MSDSHLPESFSTPTRDDGPSDDGPSDDRPVDDRPVDDDGIFDRLVDGELDEAEQRALIESLDERPDGWRRCALAFLEAQSWRRDFSGIVATVTTATRAVEHRAGRAWFTQTSTWIAAAASFLVALGLGTLFREEVRTPESQAKHPHTEPDPVDAARGGSVAAVEEPDRRTEDPGLAEVGRTVMWGSTGPALDWDTKPAIPHKIQQQLEHMGLHIMRRHGFAPIGSVDGRQLLVPIEDVQIVPIGRETY